MTDLTPPTAAMLTSDDRRSSLAPGLLSVLQTAVALRFFFALLSAAGLTFAMRHGIAPLPIGEKFSWLMAASVIEAGLLLAFAFCRRCRLFLGRRFLWIALAWLILAPLVQRAGIFILANPPALPLGDRSLAANIGFESVWTAIPVILAAWQHGRRGWQIAMAFLLAGYGVLAVVVLGSSVDSFAAFALTSLAWLGMLAFLGWVVMRLVEALRAEHEALVAANRRLAQRAATVEQLTESRERNRMARELHDTLAHSLTGVSVQLQALETLMKYDPDAAEAQLKEAQATVRSGIQESRRAIDALRATPLEDLGLSEALRRLCRGNAERTGMAYRCVIADGEALDPLTEQAIYRIAEAAVANAEQHAAATQITVHFSYDPHLRLQIEDNGVGFDPEFVPENRYGLTGMYERAALVGGQLSIESVPRQGTRVLFEIKS